MSSIVHGARINRRHSVLGLVEGVTEGQQLALNQVKSIAAESQGLFDYIRTHRHGRGHEFLVVEVSLNCGAIDHRRNGLPLRERERFLIWTPTDFPFDHPRVLVSHDRWASYPHVQWKRQLCLYQAPAVEWNPSDGMFGFLLRLQEWLASAAKGNLDPDDAPLHPPVAYATRPDVPLVVSRTNVPSHFDLPWLGFVQAQRVTEGRIDIIGWRASSSRGLQNRVGAALLLGEQLPFEFPETVADLLNSIENSGVEARQFVDLLTQAGQQCSGGTALLVVIGSPMRRLTAGGTVRIHLAAWRISSSLLPILQSGGFGRHAHQLATVRIDWCPVMEARPEVTRRRDSGSRLGWFTGRTVELWGCGALGGWIAEFVARAKVKRLILRDHGLVTPGVLVRQPFRECDVGCVKSVALKNRIEAIDPEIDVKAFRKDVRSSVLGAGRWSEQADLIIDATADAAVLAKSEYVRRSGRAFPSLASVVVGRRADQGLLVLARPDHSGGTADVARAVKLEAYEAPDLRQLADEFWLSAPRGDHFQPEPGCSEPTFRGSAAEVAALAGVLLERLAAAVSRPKRESATATLVSLRSTLGSTATCFERTMRFEPDVVVTEARHGYEVRVSPAVIEEMNSAVEQSRHEHGADVETGGVLFGERDDVSRIAWVSEASGPPPGSSASRSRFVCGTVGVATTDSAKRRQFRGSVKFIGMWHTHPTGDLQPSPEDRKGMRDIVETIDPRNTRALLLIVAPKSDSTPEVAAHLFERSDADD